MVTIVKSKRKILSLSFVLLAFLSTGCKERIYGVYGDIHSPGIDCTAYPSVQQTLPMMDRLTDLFWQGTETFDLNRLTYIEQEIRELMPKVEAGLDPQFTENKYEATYEWRINDLNLPANAHFTVKAVTIRGKTVPIESLKMEDVDGFHILQFKHSANILEVCALSKSYQALVEVSDGDNPLFYYRLMM